MRKRNVSLMALFLSVTVGIQPCAFVSAEEAESGILIESNETESDETYVTGQYQEKAEDYNWKISDEGKDTVEIYEDIRQR